ncbi:MAG TPA: DnaJ domain-containing protein [Kofleriaceae bacterium]|jgi:molecular chaperone DnaJ|nr:DnaJ domain-containing protein [Kofleriaceae bacterium]
MPQQIDFDPSVDYYKALGVNQSATADEIKRAYRKLAKAYHPDSTGGDKAKESRFKDISNAYDVLGDAKKRAMYDEIRAGGGLPRGFPGAYTYSGQGGGPGVFDLGDLFSQFFGGNAGRGGRVQVEHLDFDDRPRGRRRARDAQDAEFEQTVKASDGSWLRVDGQDVSSDIRISFDRAILGTVATVATIDGKAEVKIPPGTSSGKKLRLRGKGMPDHAGGHGDHYVTIQIDVPHELDDEGKKLLAQLATRLRKRGHND